MRREFTATEKLLGYDLKSMEGRSLPSQLYGAWIVQEVRGSIEGRSRLVTGDLKGEQWVWTRDLVRWFEILDKESEKDLFVSSPY